jgi:hypothetical protein
LIEDLEAQLWSRFSHSLSLIQPPVINPPAATAFTNTTFYPSNKMASQSRNGHTPADTLLGGRNKRQGCLSLSLLKNRTDTNHRPCFRQYSASINAARETPSGPSQKKEARSATQSSSLFLIGIKHPD